MTGAKGGKVTENILPNYTCIIHPMRRIHFIHEFARRNVELKKFSLAFHFFCKLGKDHNYPVSVEGHLSLVDTTVPQVLIYTITLLYERRKKDRHVLLLLVFCDKCAKLKFCHVSCCT
jgi:hypothetical protein